MTLTSCNSPYTKEKQECFEELVQTNMKMCRNILKKSHVHPLYHYFDLNAGSGQSLSESGYGSPLIVASNAYQLSLPFVSHLFEKDLRTFNSLLKNIPQWERNHPKQNCLFSEYSLKYKHEYHYGDNEIELAKTLCEFQDIKKKIYGVVYADPPGTRPPFELLKQMVSLPCFEFLDIIINFSATNLKRIRKAKHTTYNQYMSDALRDVGKKHIILREPSDIPKSKAFQWTFAILTNWEGYPQFKTKGFYNIESKEGQRIVEYLDYTREELLHKVNKETYNDDEYSDYVD